MTIQSAAVFCGSKQGNNLIYTQHAVTLGNLLVHHNITLVYGGGKVGIMGAIANAVLENSGKVIGVIPKLLVEWEQQHTDITTLHVVEDMHVRKKMMYELCDIAIVLPGGYGTLDELFEIITWNNLKIHEKKIFIVNSNGFYNSLIEHINNMHTAGFLYENWQERIIVVNQPEEIFNYVPQNVT